MKKIAILLLISSSFLIQNSFSAPIDMQLLPPPAENMSEVSDTTKVNLQPDSLDITNTEAADLQKLIDQVKTISEKYISSPTIPIESKLTPFTDLEANQKIKAGKKILPADAQRFTMQYLDTLTPTMLQAFYKLLKTSNISKFNISQIKAKLSKYKQLKPNFNFGFNLGFNDLKNIVFKGQFSNQPIQQMAGTMIKYPNLQINDNTKTKTWAGMTILGYLLGVAVGTHFYHLNISVSSDKLFDYYSAYLKLLGNNSITLSPKFNFPTNIDTTLLANKLNLELLNSVLNNIIYGSFIIDVRTKYLPLSFDKIKKYQALQDKNSYFIQLNKSFNTDPVITNCLDNCYNSIPQGHEYFHPTKPSSGVQYISPRQKCKTNYDKYYNATLDAFKQYSDGNDDDLKNASEALNNLKSVCLSYQYRAELNMPLL